MSGIIKIEGKSCANCKQHLTLGTSIIISCGSLYHNRDVYPCAFSKFEIKRMGGGTSVG